MIRSRAVGLNCRAVIHAGCETKLPPRGDNIRAMIHAIYDTKPAPRGDDICATITGSNEMRPRPWGDDIRATIHASYETKAPNCYCAIDTNICQKFDEISQKKLAKSPASFPTAGELFTAGEFFSPTCRNFPTGRNSTKGEKSRLKGEKTRQPRGAILAAREKIGRRVFLIPGFFSPILTTILFVTRMRQGI